MKKLLFSLFFAVFASTMFAVPASSQPMSPPVSTVNVIPNFTGTWMLGLPGLRMTSVNGNRNELTYGELTLNFTGGGGGSDGSMSFGGEVVGRTGSLVNIFYNPNITPKYVEMYLYMPEPSIGSTGQYFLQVQVKLFVSPDGSYLYGTMSASFYDSLTGNSVPTVLYHSAAFFSRYGARG